MSAEGEVLLRPIEARDVAAIVDLHRRAFTRDFITSLGERFLREVFYGAILERREGVGVVAVRDGALLGFVVGSYPSGRWYRALLAEHWTAVARDALGRLAEGPLALLELAEVSVAMLKGSGEPDDFPSDLGYIAVEAETRGLGVGRKLVARFLETLAARGASGCWTKTTAWNAAAQRLYESSGFRRIGRRRIRRAWSIYYGVDLAPRAQGALAAASSKPMS